MYGSYIHGMKNTFNVLVFWFSFFFLFCLFDGIQAVLEFLVILLSQPLKSYSFADLSYYLLQCVKNIV